ncbi:HsdM family class I SAM-dependent methyltransferase [Pontibacter sp. MBLB2868]|uniref:HsdM family class I SAM-dependent methyltransferase n=1 Tax=Pontibacter sp. MBLB2868 TaxID=3451555 RepID=UPI003F752A6E
MNHNIFKFITKFSKEPFCVNRLIVSAFAQLNSLKVTNNKLLANYIINDNDESELKHLNEFLQYLDEHNEGFSFENLITLFEFVISPDDKVVNGAVYTPHFIREYIIDNALSISSIDKSAVRLADIACGCGGFLFNAAIRLKRATSRTCSDIFRENIFGVDITSYSIERTKILLSLLALSEDEDVEEFQFNLEVGNSLNFSWRDQFPLINQNNGFDIIVGNPPYVTVKKVDEESRALLANWSVTKSGNTDLYIAFFQIGYEALAQNGVLGYITVNSFIKSINGRLLRQYFTNERPSFYLIDFGGEQLFHKRTTYTCVCFLQKKVSETIHYIKRSSKTLPELASPEFYVLPYKLLHPIDGWNLLQKKTLANITQIENMGRPLGTYLIRNGFATLANDIFVFTPAEDTETHYILNTKEGQNFPIEKGICVPAIKPSIIKNERDLFTLREQVIFPYRRVLQHDILLDHEQVEEYTLELFSERFLQNTFPDAYNYLGSKRAKLANRDYGKGNYGAWFAFGRNQALTIRGAKLLFPYISDRPYFILTEEPDLLFYNGYALISNEIDELRILKKILSSNIFWYYVSNMSKPYAHNYFALAKNHIKNFGVCELTPDQRTELLTLENQEDINHFLAGIYNVYIDELELA